MSWLISKALMQECENLPSLQALGADFSQVKFSDGELSALSNGTTMPVMYLLHGKTMEASKLSRFGMMCKPLMGDYGAEWLMSYLAAFPVKIFPQPGKALELTAQNQACGSITNELLARYDRNSHTLKTLQHSLFEGLTKLSVTLPRSGMTINGGCFHLPILVRSMYERGYSYLPTPTAHNSKEGAYPAEYTRKTPTLATHAGGKINPEWSEHLMGWPLGHTDLKPLETGKTRKWLQEHLEFFQKTSNALTKGD
jgi:hypothetical protein